MKTKENELKPWQRRALADAVAAFEAEAAQKEKSLGVGVTP